MLVSADKDGYVPPQSARVQMCDASIRDAKREVPHGQVFFVCSVFPVFSLLFFCVEQYQLWFSLFQHF